MRTLLLAFVIVALAGCAPVEPRALKPVHYACEDGRAFSVTYDSEGESAIIEIERMRFALIREPSASGAAYTCEVLTLRTKGRDAMVEMEGRKSYTGCRELQR
ncbi:MAG: MliC family protein [Betaproteobacteria bacterium]|nr:MliC family protein [Betaproteobacteria bacterium]